MHGERGEGGGKGGPSVQMNFPSFPVGLLGDVCARSPSSCIHSAPPTLVLLHHALCKFHGAARGLQPLKTSVIREKAGGVQNLAAGHLEFFFFFFTCVLQS